MEQKVIYNGQLLVLTQFWATGEPCLWITDPQQIEMPKMEFVGGYPNEYCIFLKNLTEGEEIQEFISGTKTDRVKEIAKALQELDFETYIDKFDMSAFSQNDIYPDIWGYEDEADLIKDDLRNSFENLKKFYEKMAEQERAVLVSIC